MARKPAVQVTPHAVYTVCVRTEIKAVTYCILAFREDNLFHSRDTEDGSTRSGVSLEAISWPLDGARRYPMASDALKALGQLGLRLAEAAPGRQLDLFGELPK